jgi:hypothetical protein
LSRERNKALTGTWHCRHNFATRAPMSPKPQINARFIDELPVLAVEFIAYDYMLLKCIASAGFFQIIRLFLKTLQNTSHYIPRKVES